MAFAASKFFQTVDNRRFTVEGSNDIWAIFDERNGFNVYAVLEQNPTGYIQFKIDTARTFFNDEVTAL